MPSPSISNWTEWALLPAAPATTAEALAEQLDGGQAFRWNRTDDGIWTGGWSDLVVRLRLDSSGRLQWSAPAALRASLPAALTTYLGLEANLHLLIDALPWRSDAHLAACLTAFPGLRILRQPFGETLLGFLCSATKQIVQIKQMLALLAHRHGEPLGVEVDGQAWHRLPTWDALAQTSEADLRACLLGFRARYIHQTALFLAANPGWLRATELAPYPEAKERLCTLPGVGEKVADCVLLFGAGRLEAFPVDTWILKALARRYGLEGWKPPQVAQFGRVHFGPLAGLAQQYLFAYERRAADDSSRQGKK